MLLTITTTHKPATDLGYLLHKNPDRLHEVELPFGVARLFYPEVGEERCTAALLLEINPINLVRGRRGYTSNGGTLQQYVNDRPYVASSFLSVALSKMLGTAMNGRSKERQELAEAAIPLHAKIAVLPCRGGEGFLRSLFEPLGYTVQVTHHPLDTHFPEWGESPYYTVELQATCRLSDLLAHLYVLVPVLDDEKHYWVSDDEVEKLLRRGAGWLASHPQREQITRRYLRHRAHLTREALQRLAEEDQPDPDRQEELEDAQEEQVEAPISLNQQRLDAALASLKEAGARQVLDLGCGEGRLLQKLLDDPAFTEIVGVDVSYRVLEKAKERLRWERMPERRRARVTLLQGALTYRDARLSGYDAAAVIEVIEHLDPPRLQAFERALFEHARPATVVLTTPNAEYNIKWETLPAGRFRHRDHRFEWTRAQFQDWADSAAKRFGYTVKYLPVGPEDELVGPPTQMGVFSRE